MLMKSELERKGTGEHGEAVHVQMENEYELDVAHRFGHNVLASSKIPLNRAIPDHRSDFCKKHEYRASLPKVSVIIPFFDEHAMAVKRSIMSVLKRTQEDLLLEVILVSDGAAPDTLINDINHIIIHDFSRWKKKIKVLQMNKKCGIICSRLAGARYASGDVFFFLDCHTEVGYNYLPPLIEPISYDYKAVVTPTVDIINRDTFEIIPLGEGITVFDWNFHPQRIPLSKHDTDKAYYRSPIMTGVAFAISAKYYWELVPDSGLTVYSGDEFERSFKVNLCGGKLFESGCSRVAHIYRRFPYDRHEYAVDYKAR